ncbi:hypothetical protein PILCRDRAFT_12357 [Piloderma croceum F 1598]|uniref:Uncharacterized protein n=1 Tax=Piloderma croceum (strain F 1598) TaxID=765440 RepID=A0A0C3BHZ3_PILCF|nr:hypothetical protein PILCRDRAFT_12357 [Piloderma croceum F 1598]
MSFPNPYEAPEDFFQFLKTLNLDIAVTMFLHSRSWPLPGPNGRFKEDVAQMWCKRMDLLLGKLGRAQGSHEHQDAISALHELCTKAIGNREEKEKANALRLMKEEEDSIKAAERELERKKKALRNAQKAAEVFVDNTINEDDDMVSVSTAGEQGVPKAMTKCQAKEETRKKLEQAIHPTLCTACEKNNEATCTGPVGYSCNVCWKMKKSCSNGGRHHTRVKEEPASPPKKRKIYSMSGSDSIGTIDPFDEADIPKGGSAKRQKTSTTCVRFDGVAASSSTRPPPRPTRKLTRVPKASQKIEGDAKLNIDKLFEKLGQEFHAIGRTCEMIAEEINLHT